MQEKWLMWVLKGSQPAPKVLNLFNVEMEHICLLSNK